MKILFTDVPLSYEESCGSFSYASSSLPHLSLCYLASMVPEHECKVLTCFVDQININQLITKIEHFKPDLICFSVNTVSYNNFKNILGEIKSRFDLPIIAGGPHINILPELTMQENPLLDFAIYGEGEHTFKEFIEKKELKDIDGLIYRQGNEIKINKPRQLEENIDLLPIPNFSLLGDFKRFHHTISRHSKGNTAVLISSRGCPYNCGFCERGAFGRRWRSHSVERIMKEIEILGNRIGFLVFQDDNFSLDKKRAIEFCKAKIKKGYKWKWGFSSRVDNINEEEVQWLKKAGCELIFFGIERGNQEDIDYVQKKVTIGQIKTAINLCKKYGIKSHGSFIIGIPGETQEKMRSIIKLIKSTPFSSISVHIYVPYPGTKMRGDAEKSGCLETDWKYYSSHTLKPAYVPEGFTAEDLQDWQMRIYRSFFMTPSYILKNINKLFTISFIKKMPSITNSLFLSSRFKKSLRGD